MTFEETKQILQILRINYPNSFRNLKAEDSHAYLSLWAEAFKHDDVQVVISAVKSIIYSDTREFAPNIGQVKSMINKLTSEPQMTELEAWAHVKKAISRSGYHSNEEFNKLPPIIQKLVGSPRQLFEWSQTDSDEVNTVIASNFQRSFKIMAQREQEYKALPLEVKQLFKIGHNENGFKQIEGKIEHE